MQTSEEPRQSDADERVVIIGSRASPLAVAQAEAFAKKLTEVSDGRIRSEIRTFKTTGDKIQDRPLQEAGGKGLFTKELDRAQEQGEIDIGVHSLKDVTVKLSEHLELTGFMEREDPRDGLVGPFASIADIPHGAVVGTSSVRRRAQLLALRPDLKIVEFRGNVQTRLAKLADGVADATLLAMAGLNRLGQPEIANGVLSREDILPAAGQGIVAATIRSDAPEWLRRACAAITHGDTHLAALAERAFLRHLDGSCRTPFAAQFHIKGDGVEFIGEVLSNDGAQRWRSSCTLPARPTPDGAEALGLSVAEAIVAQQDAQQ